MLQARGADAEHGEDVFESKQGEWGPLTEEAEKRQKRFFRAVAASERALLLLDYDGTLAGFRVDRFQSRPWAGVRELLTAMQAEGRTRLAVITGRPSEEIAPMLALPRAVEVWGLHGAERLYPNGRRVLDAARGASHRKLNAVRAQLKKDALGGLYEDKANAAVLHWRGFPATKARAIEQRARALFEPLAKLEGLRLLNFDGGVELRAGRDKGGAVEAILAEEKPKTPVAYLGDDLSDEAAFRAVNRARGARLSVLVRRKQRPSAAQIWLRPPAELRGFLQQWKQALQA
jgi:trehalose 6-phosphate phosphatase